jgi:predicted nucleic acid-binding Zn ribbon protein
MSKPEICVICLEKLDQITGKRVRFTCSAKCRKALSRREQKRKRQPKYIQFQIDWHLNKAEELYEKGSDDFEGIAWHEEKASEFQDKLELSQINHRAERR